LASIVGAFGCANVLGIEELARKETVPAPQAPPEVVASEPNTRPVEPTSRGWIDVLLEVRADGSTPDAGAITTGRLRASTAGGAKGSERRQAGTLAPMPKRGECTAFARDKRLSFADLTSQPFFSRVLISSRSLTGVVELEPDNNAWFGSARNEPLTLASNMKLSVSAENGGIVEGFALRSIAVPNSIAVDEPANGAFTVSRSAPFALTWTPASRGDILFWIASGENDRDEPWAIITCRGGATKGTFEVPGAFTSQLLSGASSRLGVSAVEEQHFVSGDVDVNIVASRIDESKSLPVVVTP